MYTSNICIVFRLFIVVMRSWSPSMLKRALQMNKTKTNKILTKDKIKPQHIIIGYYWDHNPLTSTQRCGFCYWSLVRLKQLTLLFIWKISTNVYDFKAIFKSINRMSNLLFCRCTSFWKILNRGKTRDPKSRTKCLITISINFGNNYIIGFGKCFSQFFISGCKRLAMTTPCKKNKYA